MAQPDRRYTFAEFVAFERASETKHELVDGRIIAMAGGTPRHNALAMRVGTAVDGGRRSGCNAFQSDQLVRVMATGRATYPDISVVCGPLERDPDGMAITNPTLVIEVLSPSTEKDDRGAKWGHYQRIPSLKEYVLVSQDEQAVERFRRNDSGDWTYARLTEGHVELATGGVLDIEKLYADLPE